MTDETWTIELGERSFNVPRLPFKISRKVYPICQRLSNADLPMRIVGGGLGREGYEKFQLTDEEMDDLATIALLSAQAADPSFTQEQFDELPITPGQLNDAFFEIRKATGGWRAPSVEGQDPPGEDQKVMDAPPTSTSTE